MNVTMVMVQVYFSGNSIGYFKGFNSVYSLPWQMWVLMTAFKVILNTCIRIEKVTYVICVCLCICVGEYVCRLVLLYDPAFWTKLIIILILILIVFVNDVVLTNWFD